MKNFTGMNILILQGSPRANGNTAWIAEECRKAAEAAGHMVTLVDLAHKKSVFIRWRHDNMRPRFMI